MGARRGGGGGAKVGRRPPPSKIKKAFWLYWGPFCYFFFIWRPFATFFSFLGAFSPCGAFLLLFTLWWGHFFGPSPPPLRKFLRAPMIARRVREHAPRKFFCVTAISVSSGHVLLRFCLKNDKNNDKL